MVKRDITPDITERMAALEKDIQDLNRKRATLEDRLRVAGDRLKALRLVLDGEMESQGKLVTAKVSLGGRTAWAGVNLRDAVRRLKEQNPGWAFEKIRDRLIDDGFDFKGKEPGKAVNMALVSLRREQNSGDEAEG